jgi:hypothetical protein
MSAVRPQLRVVRPPPTPIPGPGKRPLCAEILKRCGCGADYTPAEWRHLHLVGRMRGLGSGTVLELRICARCGSSISVKHRGSPELVDLALAIVVGVLGGLTVALLSR